MTQVAAYAARSAAHSLAPFDIERRARRQAQMREYPDNHRRLFDGGDDLQGAAHCGQCSMSIPKTRLSRRAQPMRAGASYAS